MPDKIDDKSTWAIGGVLLGTGVGLFFPVETSTI